MVTFPDVLHVLIMGRPLEALAAEVQQQLKDRYPNAAFHQFRPMHAQDALAKAQEFGTPEQVVTLVPAKPIVHMMMSAGYHVLAERDDAPIGVVHSLIPDVRDFPDDPAS